MADVKGALAAGIAAIHAWAAGERAKIAAAHAGQIAADAGVAALAAEFKSLHVDEKLPGKWLGQWVHILNAHGKHLQLRDNDTFDHHSNKGGWERFLIEDGGDGRVFIKCAAHGGAKRVQAMDNKTGVRTHTNSGGWEKWRMLEAPGGKVIFQSNFGMHLSQDDHGKVSQSPNTAGWEQFTIVAADDSRAKRRADVEGRLHAAEAAAKAAADATAASHTAGLDAEVARRIAAKNDHANRLEAELRTLAAL